MFPTIVSSGIYMDSEETRRVTRICRIGGANESTHSPETSQNEGKEVSPPPKGGGMWQTALETWVNVEI